MFALNKTNAVIVHLNMREEKHGEEDVLAVDVKLRADVPNSFLDELAPGLRQALYTKADQADIESDHLATVRFPQLPALFWAGKMEEAAFVIGPNKTESLEFSADIAKVQVAPKDGGTVTVTFTAQILPEPDDVGTLTGWLGNKVKVSVTPAPVSDDPPVE